jgi:Bacterial transglutaminase-like N-terminal region
MLKMRVHHRTTYRYHEPVILRPHRLMLRPRESRELRLLSMQLDLRPAAVVTWAQDVAGSMVATATFTGMTDTLTISSIAELELDGRRVVASLRRCSLRHRLPIPLQ